MAPPFPRRGTGFGAAPGNGGRRIAGRDACPPKREESVSTAPVAPSPDGWSTAAGAIGTIFPAPSKSTRSALCSSMSRFPLLRRTTAVIPALFRASTLCRIIRATFLGVMLRLRSGSICSESSVGVPIKLFRSVRKAERSVTICSPAAQPASRCPTPAPTHFRCRAGAQAPGTRCPGPRRRASPCRCHVFLPPG